MNILVYGTDSFNDYSTFMRGLVVCIDNNHKEETREVVIYSAGPYALNHMTAEFCNKTLDYFKQKKIKIKFHRIPIKTASKKIAEINPDEVISFQARLDNTSKDPLKYTCELFGIKYSFYRV
jgi:hypothetical protein